MSEKLEQFKRGASSVVRITEPSQAGEFLLDSPNRVVVACNTQTGSEYYTVHNSVKYTTPDMRITGNFGVWTPHANGPWRTRYAIELGTGLECSHETHLVFSDYSHLQHFIFGLQVLLEDSHMKACATETLNELGEES